MRDAAGAEARGVAPSSAGMLGADTHRGRR